MGGGNSKKAAEDPHHKGDGMFFLGNFTFENEEKMKVFTDLNQSRESNTVKMGGNEVLLKTGDLECMWLTFTTPDFFIKVSEQNGKDFAEKEEEKAGFASFKTFQARLYNANDKVKEAMKPWEKDPRITIEYPTADISHAIQGKNEEKSAMLIIQNIECADEKGADCWLKHQKVASKTFQKDNNLLTIKKGNRLENVFYTTNERWSASNKALQEYSGMQEWIGSMKSADVTVLGDANDSTKESMDKWSNHPSGAIKITVNPESCLVSKIKF